MNATPNPSPSHGAFSVGDNIKFVITRHVGRSITFKTMHGKIVDFSPKGTKATVKYHGGNYACVKVSDIRHQDQPSPLNSLLERP